MRTTFTWLTLASLTTATALSVASCQQAPGTWAGAPARPAPAGPLWDEPQFTTMLRAYRQKLPGKSRAARFEMFDNAASLAVQDPAKPVNAVSYDYKGGELTGPSPVDLFGVFQDSNLEDNLFDWDQVAVERIPALVKEALARNKLAGARVVAVRITRKALDSEEMGRRIEGRIKAKTRAMERKLRRQRDPLASDEPQDDENTEQPGELLKPLGVEISVQMQAPGGFGWLTADARGRITGSGADESIKGPPADIERQSVPRPQPYWRSR